LAHQLTIVTLYIAYVGRLLPHLRDPVRPLENVREVCRGSILLADAIALTLSIRHPRRPVASLDSVGRPWWWKPNLAALVRMVEVSGFRLLQPPKRVLMPPGAGQRRSRPSLRQLRNRTTREMTFHAWRGDPHAAVR